MDRTSAARRWERAGARLPRALATTALVVALVAACSWFALAAPGDRPADRPSTAGQLTLTDDDGGAPMFTVPALAAGDVHIACTRVHYRGMAGDDTVRLVATVADEGLADRLGVVVERGAGGGFGRCAGFTPRGEVFRGTLRALADAGVRGAPLGWRPDQRQDAQSFRFTVVASADLPGDAPARATATFAWTATETPPAATARPPAERDATGDRSDPGGRVVERPGDADATRSPQPAPRADRSPARDDAPGGRRGPAAGRDGTAPAGAPAAPADGAGKAAGGGLSRVLGDAARAVARAAVESAKRLAFPAVLLIVVALFLLVQHRIDSRDPKLALAPVDRDPDLDFPPLPQGAPA